MSSWLFNIYNDKCLRMALLGDEGVDLRTVKLNGFTFAGDEVVTAESVDVLQRMLSRLGTNMKCIRFRINVNKTKIIVAEGRDKKTICNIALDKVRNK